jgi:peptide/nickel transport system substrate-binding protein
MRRILLAAALLMVPLAAEAQTLRIGLREDPDILDPTLGSSYVGRIVYAAMCDKLFDLDENLRIVPMLATSYRYEDPTHLILELRDGVTFHDGTKFDAEAVKYKINRDLTAKGSMRAGEINSIQSVEVISPLSVRITLKAPASQLLAILTDRAGIMISPKAVEAAGDKFGLAPVCAGPYAFDSRVAQDRIVLKRYPGYWNAKAYHFDQIIYQPITSPAVRLANLQAGSLDLVEYITPTDIDAVKKDPKLKLAVGDGLAYTGITFNTDNGPAKATIAGQNKLVRQAFDLSIDRTALIRVVYNGMYSPTVQANTPSSPYYIKDFAPPERNVEKAKALLKQAGVTLPVQIMLTVPNSPDVQQAAEVIQSMVAESGFEVKIKTMEFASSLQAGYAGDFQAYMIGWSGRSDPDGNMWQMLHTGGTFNYGKYSNAEVDTLLDDARKVTGIDERRALYSRVWKQEREDLPLVYLWTSRNVVGMRREVTGFRQVPDGLIRLEGVTLAK